jgi:hypothetical protein
MHNGRYYGTTVESRINDGAVAFQELFRFYLRLGKSQSGSEHVMGLKTAASAIWSLRDCGFSPLHCYDTEKIIFLGRYTDLVIGMRPGI